MPGRDSVQTITLRYPFATVFKPFHQTRLGKLPPELRVQIFLELLATPPPYAGHDFAISPSRPKDSRRAPQKFVDIKASWYHVTRTCRQIYQEAHPLFFASKSYYLSNAKDARLLLDGWPWPSLIRLDTITTLCLKDLVETSARYSKETIDQFLSDPSSYFARYYTRQELEAQTDSRIEGSVITPLLRLKNLQTLGFCFLVGEEAQYVDLVFGMTGLKKGLVEFLDAQHWTIRPQDAEDVWNIQYAGFYTADWGLNKNGENIPVELCINQRHITDIDSRAPGLQDGDRRYVEVQIQRPAKKDSPQKTLYGHRSEFHWGSASNHNVVGSQTAHSTQLETSQVTMETIQVVEAAEATALVETSEGDISMPVLDPESIRLDQSPVLEFQRTASPEPTSESNTDEEENHAVINPESEGVSSTQPETRPNHQTEDPLLSRPLESVTSNAPADTEKDLEFLFDTNDEDDPDQTNTKPTNQAPERIFPQNPDRFYGDSATEADEPQNTIKESRKGGVRRAKLRKAFRQPLLDIVVTPSPYTEEEMESPEKWQQHTFSGDQKQAMKAFRQKEKPSSAFGKKQGQEVKDSGAATQTATPEGIHSPPASPNPSELPSKSVLVGGAFVLLLLLVILNARQERNGSDQQ